MKFTIRFSIVIALLFVASSASILVNLYWFHIDVVRLNEDNFKQEILLSGKGDKWFIQFTAPVELHRLFYV